MENRTYVIFEVSEIDKIDFNQVMNTSADTLRTNSTGTHTFVKWNTKEVPECVLALQTKGAYMNNEQILEVLSNPDWTSMPPAPVIEILSDPAISDIIGAEGNDTIEGS